MKVNEEKCIHCDPESRYRYHDMGCRVTIMRWLEEYRARLQRLEAFNELELIIRNPNTSLYTKEWIKWCMKIDLRGNPLDNDTLGLKEGIKVFIGLIDILDKKRANGEKEVITVEREYNK